jgi:hypothetical protein
LSDLILYLLITIFKDLALVCTGLPESVTLAVNLNVPAAVGVPEITPVLAMSDRPGGKEPEAIAQLYGGVPPLAVSIPEYGTRTLPLDRDVVVIVSGGICTVRVVLPATPLKVADMVAVPGPTAVASPVLFMVAIAVFEEDHVTWLVRFWVLPFE